MAACPNSNRHHHDCAPAYQAACRWFLSVYITTMQRAFLEYDSFSLRRAPISPLPQCWAYLLAGHGAFEQEHTKGISNAIYMLH
eukprot:766811-Hanusia_phi.AAC.3